MAASIRSRNSNVFDSLTRRSKPSVVITLKNQQPGPISSYTTLDTIAGEVSVTADYDTRFESLSITFEGTSRTVIEHPGVPGPQVGRYSAFHTFLRLTQPIEELQYPQPRIIEAGRTYTFPFTFVVPERLLPGACTHKHNHLQVHTAHTLLPPSLGDPLLAGNGSKLLDDMAPQMTQIQYAVRAQLFRSSPTDGKIRTSVDTKRTVRIIPAMDEAPPLSIDDDSDEYCMRKEKDVKKGALRGKLGRIVMAAAQPKAFRVPASAPADAASAAQSEECTPTTMATVHLRFDPINESQQPPRLGMLWGKLKVHTFFATEPWSDLAAKSSSLSWAVNKGIYTDTVPLACRCVASATWHKHTSSTNTSTSTTPSTTPPSSLHRRPSTQSTTSIDSSLTGPSASYSGTTYYTASILVPITLPKNRTYLPTFHSCLSSRAYSLEISLSYHTPSANLTVPTLAIRLPIQVATTESLADASAARGQPRRVRNSADEFFTPRSVAPPSSRTGGLAGREGSGSMIVERGRVRSETLSSTLSGMSSVSMAPPEYSTAGSMFSRRLSSRVPVRTAC
ncbi:hypothetical protein AJ79_08485 [Helicocarpus griseus UAMH5409]|uniref:Bul1 C-terminal domain-containing protein n=1 Tax=Helicocarpus griseus UAMH5409 TaxID=1447875 RepID=A0A2B7WSJ3_9EURO|nr:hypothetical protein AJ79_08485 [Helicocarpus griseus UAMH5409]